MLGMPGDVDEQPASRRASFVSACVCNTGERVEVSVQRRIMPATIRNMRMWW